MSLEREVEHAKDLEAQIEFGRIVEEVDGVFWVIVNGRKVPRKATVDTDFALNRQGHGVGDEVLLLASGMNDMPVILGLSPWLVNMEGTEYDAG